MLSHQALSLMFQLFLHGTLMILQKKLDMVKGQLTLLVALSFKENKVAITELRR